MPVSDRTPAEVTDADLLERVASGDEEAIAALYDRHSRLVFGLSLRMLRDRGEAEEVVQDVFLTVWSKARTFNPEVGSAAAWLVRLTRNRSIDRLRAIAVRVRTLEAVVDGPAADSPESAAARHEQRDGVLRALDGLPAEQRCLIEHAYYLGLTQSELAERFALPLGTVKTRVRTGMTTLRERLANLP